MPVQPHCLEGEEDGPGLGAHARPIQLRTGGGAKAWGLPGRRGRERREEVSSAHSSGACRAASTLRPLEGSVSCDHPVRA